MNQIIKVNDIEYYTADDVYKMEPHSFIGCSKTSRDIVTKKKLDTKDYIYMKYIKSTNEWLSSNSSYRLAKVLITKDWVEKNLIMFKTIKTEDDLKIEALKAPPTLQLTENEKFVDIEGNKLDIEVLGSKNINDIYFNVKDIGVKFTLGDVKNTLIHPNSNFMLNTHYKVFKRLVVETFTPNSNKKSQSQKKLFLTFKGLTKLLYVSHSKNAEHFQDWANNLLFTVQLGTDEMKQTLSNKMLGVSTNAVKEVCKKSIIKISCVYLFSLGTVDKLRESFNIPSNYDDNMIVIKYGRTDSLERRTAEHEKDYGEIKNVDLRLMKYAFIDNKYTSEAETDLSNFFNYSKYKYDFPNRSELAIITKDKINIVEKEYEKIRKIYAGNLIEIINEKEKLLNELRMKDKDIELINEKHKNELKDKDIEILQIKLMISEMKNKIGS
jgi:hypothetical protein